MSELNLFEALGLKLLLAFVIVLALFVYFDRNSVLNGKTPEENKKLHGYYSDRSDLDLNPSIKQEKEEKSPSVKDTSSSSSSSTTSATITKPIKSIRKRKT